MATTVTTQAELDKALSSTTPTIIDINSPRGIWLEVRDSKNHTVRAYGSSTVRASNWVSVIRESKHATITAKNILDVSGIDMHDLETWLDFAGVEVRDGKAVLYKAVDDEFYAGHGYVLTQYPVGATIEAPDWRDDNQCGGGYYLCPSPSQALAHYNSAKRFVEVEVKLKHIRPISGSVAKAKVKKLTVIAEVTEFGKRVLA